MSEFVLPKYKAYWDWPSVYVEFSTEDNSDDSVFLEQGVEILLYQGHLIGFDIPNFNLFMSEGRSKEDTLNILLYHRELRKFYPSILVSRSSIDRILIFFSGIFSK